MRTPTLTCYPGNREKVPKDDRGARPGPSRVGQPPGQRPHPAGPAWKGLGTAVGTCAQEKHLIAPIGRVHLVHGNGGEAVGGPSADHQGPPLQRIHSLVHEGVAAHEVDHVVGVILRGLHGRREGPTRALWAGDARQARPPAGACSTVRPLLCPSGPTPCSAQAPLQPRPQRPAGLTCRGAVAEFSRADHPPSFSLPSLPWASTAPGALPCCLPPTPACPGTAPSALWGRPSSTSAVASSLSQPRPHRLVTARCTWSDDDALCLRCLQWPCKPAPAHPTLTSSLPPSLQLPKAPRGSSLPRPTHRHCFRTLAGLLHGLAVSMNGGHILCTGHLPYPGLQRV